jgi:hypothetical protein
VTLTAIAIVALVEAIIAIFAIVAQDATGLREL